MSLAHASTGDEHVNISNNTLPPIAERIAETDFDNATTLDQAIAALHKLAALYDSVDPAHLTLADYEAIFPNQHITSRSTLSPFNIVRRISLSGSAFDQLIWTNGHFLEANERMRSAEGRMNQRLKVYATRITREQLDDPVWLTWVRQKASAHGMTSEQISAALEKARKDATDGINHGWVCIDPEDLSTFYAQQDEFALFHWSR